MVAKRLGIKPGSAQFHALKGSVGKSSGKYKSHKGKSGKHDDGVLLYDGDKDNKGKGNSDKSNKGNSDKGKGNSDKGKGNGNKP